MRFVWWRGKTGHDTSSAVIPLKPKNGLTRISCTRYQVTAACAAFIEESRIKFITPTDFTGNPGEWGTQHVVAGVAKNARPKK
jgi:hypothetical protein